MKRDQVYGVKDSVGPDGAGLETIFMVLLGALHLPYTCVILSAQTLNN